MVAEESLTDAIEALAEAIIASGGPVALGETLNISSQAISQWKLCPSGRVLAVENASGVSRHRLRPDLYPKEDDVEALKTGDAA